MDGILRCYHSNETSSVVLSHGTIYLVCTFESVDEILWCYHSNETSSTELLHSISYFLGFYQKELIIFSIVKLSSYQLLSFQQQAVLL